MTKLAKNIVLEKLGFNPARIAPLMTKGLNFAKKTLGVGKDSVGVPLRAAKVQPGTYKDLRSSGYKREDAVNIMRNSIADRTNQNIARGIAGAGLAGGAYAAS